MLASSILAAPGANPEYSTALEESKASKEDRLSGPGTIDFAESTF